MLPRNVVLVAAGLVTCSCVTVTLAPGAEKVKFTHYPLDVAACKAVGNVYVKPDILNPQFVEFQLRNRTVGLEGNALFYTGWEENEGVAYRCP